LYGNWRHEITSNGKAAFTTKVRLSKWAAWYHMHKKLS